MKIHLPGSNGAARGATASQGPANNGLNRETFAIGNLFQTAVFNLKARRRQRPGRSHGGCRQYVSIYELIITRLQPRSHRGMERETV